MQRLLSHHGYRIVRDDPPTLGGSCPSDPRNALTSRLLRDPTLYFAPRFKVTNSLTGRHELEHDGCLCYAPAQQAEIIADVRDRAARAAAVCLHDRVAPVHAREPRIVDGEVEVVVAVPVPGRRAVPVGFSAFNDDRDVKIVRGTEGDHRAHDRSLLPFRSLDTGKRAALTIECPDMAPSMPYIQWRRFAFLVWAAFFLMPS